MDRFAIICDVITQLEAHDVPIEYVRVARYRDKSNRWVTVRQRDIADFTRKCHRYPTHHVQIAIDTVEMANDCADALEEILSAVEALKQA